VFGVELGKVTDIDETLKIPSVLVLLVKNLTAYGWSTFKFSN
jgi:hypothetical protein